jgi:Uncharacterized protein related to capsule biosynthesis enzymes
MAANSCLICLKPTRGAEYHSKCSKRLFGTVIPPTLNLNGAQLNAAAMSMAGKMSISGVQEKVSLKLSEDRTTLEVAQPGGRYILKPEPNGYPALPQNEHLTMCLTSLVDIETPPFGLIRLRDGELSYIIKRFDRLEDGGKLAVEDFCQLSERPLREKYNGSAEQCVKLLRKYATEPPIEYVRLFKLLLFAWWTGNGDLHLKNISLITSPEGLCKLSPAYDLVNSKVAIPEDDFMALPMLGRKRKLTRENWLTFAEYGDILKPAKRLLNRQTAALDDAIDFVHRSYLPAEMQAAYEDVLRSRNSTLIA